MQLNAKLDCAALSKVFACDFPIAAANGAGETLALVGETAGPEAENDMTRELRAKQAEAAAAGPKGPNGLYSSAYDISDEQVAFTIALLQAERAANAARSEQDLNELQTALDAAGFVPLYGVAADLTNAGISVARGDYELALVSVVAAIPLVGDSAKAAKMAAKAADAAQASAKAAQDAAAAAAKTAARAGDEAAAAAARGSDDAAKLASNATDLNKLSDDLAAAAKQSRKAADDLTAAIKAGDQQAAELAAKRLDDVNLKVGKLGDDIIAKVGPKAPKNFNITLSSRGSSRSFGGNLNSRSSVGSGGIHDNSEINRIILGATALGAAATAVTNASAQFGAYGGRCFSWGQLGASTAIGTGVGYYIGLKSALGGRGGGIALVARTAYVGVLGSVLGDAVTGNGIDVTQAVIGEALGIVGGPLFKNLDNVPEPVGGPVLETSKGVVDGITSGYRGCDAR